MPLQVIATPRVSAGTIATLIDDLPLLVTRGAVLNSSGAVAIASSLSAGDYTLRLNGQVFGAATAVVMGSVNGPGEARLTLAATGVIGGDYVGVQMQGQINTVTNRGEIAGGFYGVTLNSPPSVTGTRSNITNSGEIIGGSSAITRGSQVTTGTIRLTNTTTGVLEGGDFSYNGNYADAEDQILNDGVMIGDVWLGPGDDSYRGLGTVEGKVFGGDGQDTLSAGDGPFSLWGEAGHDRLTGRDAYDSLTGGQGRDTLTGGAGNDSFIFLNPGDAGDTITDFHGFDMALTKPVAGDMIRVLASGFGGGLVAGATLAASRFVVNTTNAAKDANDRFILRSTDKTLWFDADGTGSGAAVKLADLQAGADISYRDIILV